MGLINVLVPDRFRPGVEMIFLDAAACRVCRSATVAVAAPFIALLAMSLAPDASGQPAASATAAHAAQVTSVETEPAGGHGVGHAVLAGPEGRTAPGPADPVLPAAVGAPDLGWASVSEERPRLYEAATGLAFLPDESPDPATVEVTLVAAPARASLLPGSSSEVYAFNGRIPGPVLEVHEGDRVVVHFRNELPEPSTIHWHGLHLPIDSDGSPLDPVEPGSTRDYVFTIPHGTAGTYWYHPHPHHRTGHQVGRGLFGAVVVRAADDPLAGLPEQLLVLSDNRFTEDGALDFPEPHTLHGRIDFENGREGPVLLVNGQVMPELSIRSGEVQRWRIVNASASRVFRLALQGHALLHVGSDGGLFERAVEVPEIVLANSERAEVLVRATGAPGTRTVLEALPYDRYVPQTRPPDWEQTRPLLTLRYTSEPPLAPPDVPETLRPVPPLDTLDAAATRLMVLTQGMINGRMMDVARVDVSARLGTTEIWQIENLVGMDHPFHLHGFRFQVLDRNGRPEPFRSWKDTVNVPKHETVRFIVHYDDFPGRWMFHCHILDHEDHGMMGILEVNP